MASSRRRHVYKEDSLKIPSKSVQWNLKNREYLFEKYCFEKSAFKVLVPDEPVWMQGQQNT